MKYTDEQMRQCFENVQSKKGWKYPINKVIDNPGPENLRCLHEAVIHFTGGGLTTVALPGNKIRVLAAGYYACIGA